MLIYSIKEIFTNVDTLLTLANSPQFSLSHVKWKCCFVCSGGDDGLWLFPGSLAGIAPPYFHHLLIHDGQEMYFMCIDVSHNQQLCFVAI